MKSYTTKDWQVKLQRQLNTNEDLGFNKALLPFIIETPFALDTHPYLQPCFDVRSINNADIDPFCSTSSIKLPNRHLNRSATQPNIGLAT